MSEVRYVVSQIILEVMCVSSSHINPSSRDVFPRDDSTIYSSFVTRWVVQYSGPLSDVVRSVPFLEETWEERPSRRKDF